MKRQFFNLDNDTIYKKIVDNVIDYEHINKFNNLKKRKIDNNIEYLTDSFDKFTCDGSLKIIKDIQDVNMGINMGIYDVFVNYFVFYSFCLNLYNILFIYFKRNKQNIHLK